MLRYVPLSYLSWLLGLLANLPLPQPFARWTIQIFAKAYGIDPKLAADPLSSFRSIGEFFTRDLRPELRPIQAPLVFPVDGTLRSVQTLASDGKITQVKGRDYSVAKLLGDGPYVERLRRGQVWNMYLSPRDAHHIYAPVKGTIVATTHIPGALWPVNDWALHAVSELFAVNERIVTYIESDHGLVAVVMVGATNVGRIALQYMDLETNTAPWKHKEVKTFTHSPGIDVACGEKIGTFKMGSSVILIGERPLADGDRIQTPKGIQYGEGLA